MNGVISGIGGAEFGKGPRQTPGEAILALELLKSAWWDGAGEERG
jgi:hypothetical protein